VEQRVERVQQQQQQAWRLDSNGLIQPLSGKLELLAALR
jgi:hypothetical protein